MISPFGVGALVNFRDDESLMTAGLDEWPYAGEECPADWLVQEERLQKRLGMTHFRLPPEHREPGYGVELANQYIPYVRFPQWHYCPLRGAMEKLRLFGSRMKCPCRRGLDCETMPEWKRPYLIPSRFVAVCPKGHIEDFPFMQWVHGDGGWDDTHKLRLLPGRSSAGLSGIKVACNCGKSKAMAGSFNFDAKTGGALHSVINYDCSGNMPWLGDCKDGSGRCGQYLRVVQRGASNIYFPRTVSSIYLPLWGEKADSTINKILEKPKCWDSLTEGLDDGKYIQKMRCEVLAGVYHVDPEELRAAAQEKLDGNTTSDALQFRSEEESRRQEYEAFRKGRGGETTSLMVKVCDPGSYGPELSGIFENICLIKKLRETRVLVGFTRLFPAEEEQALTDGLPISEEDNLHWLPASVVHGEGVFLEVNAQALNTWCETRPVKERVSMLKNHHNQSRQSHGLGTVEVTPKYVFLHTLAHTLISQLSFDCGYGSAALRERIYCESDTPDQPMQGILIYTASGDSEGTLGGLVRQGEPSRLRFVVDRAIRRAHWCSSDPVCIESSGQGIDNANMAACHGCVLLPETSCEKGNRLLDRGLLTGTPENPEIGFFTNQGFSTI